MYRNKKKLIIIIMCVTILLMAVGYSAFSTVLKINGTSSIASEWKVVFTKIEEVSKTSGVIIKEEPQASGTSATFNIGLTNPGDKIEYEITVENQGTLDAIIENIIGSETGSDAITFKISNIKIGDTLSKKTSTTFNIVISYDEDITEPPTITNNSLTVDIIYVQNLDQEVTPVLTATKYQTTGEEYDENAVYTSAAITLSIGNKDELGTIDSIALVDPTGEEVTAESTLIGDTNADKSYIVSKIGTYTAIVKATTNGIQTSATVEVKFIFQLQVGDYVKYDIGYIDLYSEYEFTPTDGWRVIDPGTMNADGTYNGLKLFPTGAPAVLNYGSGSAAAWWDPDTSLKANIRATNGMKTSSTFMLIEFKYKASGDTVTTTNAGRFRTIKKYNETGTVLTTYGTTGEVLPTDAFYANGAVGARILTLAELNAARTTATGTVYEETSTKSVADCDAALGFFHLESIGEFGYISSTNPKFWLATPYTNSNTTVRRVQADGDIAGTGNEGLGVRMIIDLPDNFSPVRTRVTTPSAACEL